MRKKSLVFELTDEEIRILSFGKLIWGKPVHNFGAVQFERIPLPDGVIEQGNLRQESILLDVLLRYRTRKPAENPKVYLAIPWHQGFIRSYTLPWIAEQDRESAISLLVGEEISVAQEDLFYDFLVLSEEKPQSLQILLGATRRSLLERYADVFARAGLEVSCIDFTLAILGQTLGLGPKEDVLYLQGDDASLQLIMFRGLVPERVRSLRPEEEWETEVQRFLLLYETQQPDFHLKRLIWNGNAATERLAQELQTVYQSLKVEQVKLKGIPDSWEKSLEGDRAESRAAVGYGWRILTRGVGLDLWRQAKLIRRRRRKFQGLVWLLLTVFICGVGVGFFLNRMAQPLRQEIRELTLQGAALNDRTKPQEDLQRAWNEVKMNPTKTGEVLAKVQVIKALTGAELKIEQADYRQGVLSLGGNASDAQNVQALIRNLQAMGGEQPALTSYQLTAGNAVQFSLKAKATFY